MSKQITIESVENATKKNFEGVDLVLATSFFMLTMVMIVSVAAFLIKPFLAVYTPYLSFVGGLSFVCLLFLYRIHNNKKSEHPTWKIARRFLSYYWLKSGVNIIDRLFAVSIMITFHSMLAGFPIFIFGVVLVGGKTLLL